MGYTKLFSTLITSTVWSEDDKTRILWVTMLALADKNGEVHATIPGLARMAGVDISAVEASLVKFTSPDRYSRTQILEGRRIEPIDGGWVLINHRKYRDAQSEEDARNANAIRQARWRERHKDSVTGRDMSQKEPTKVTSVMYTDTDSEADSVPSSAPRRAREARKKPAQMPDAEWLLALIQAPENEGVNVGGELTKAEGWCREHNRKCTRKFFVNWLLRADRTIGKVQAPQPAPAPTPPKINPNWLPPDDRWKPVIAKETFSPVRKQKLEAGSVHWNDLEDYEKKFILDLIPEYQTTAYHADPQN